MVIIMKKTRKAITIILLILLLTGIFSLRSGAETIYVVDGYSYTFIDNNSISLYAWDHSSDVLMVADEIMGRPITAVADRSFKNDDQLHAIDFSAASQMASIGIESFYQSGLSQKLTIPSTVVSIGERAFENCENLPAVDIFADVESIPAQCFNNCASLSEVTLPENLLSIQKFAFANCPNLSYVAIPRSVTSIARTAFSNDSSLTLGVWYGSYGYDYAIAQNIPYVLLDEVKLGDASGDGSVNINDVTTIQRYLAELETLEGIYLHAADANQDGTVDIADATVIQMYLAEYDMEYPIGEVMTQ